jgi:competence protein ComEC
MTVRPGATLRGLLVGILIGLTVSIFGISIVSAVVVLIAVYLCRAAWGRTDRVLLFLIAGLGLGLGLMLPGLSGPTENSVAAVDGYQVVEATVVSVERTSERQKLVLDDIQINQQTYENRVLIFVPEFTYWSYGDRLRFSCALESPESFDGFAYDVFLESRGIYKTCFLHESPLALSEGHGNSALRFLAGLRDYFEASAQQLFGEPQSTLLSGLLFGQELFSAEWDERLQQTGTTHIVAASGYNVALVTWLLFGLLTWLGMRRQKAFWILGLAIIAYVLLAGAEAAVVRAGVMGGLILLAKTMGRRASMVNVLLLTAVVMLAFEPLLLRYDVGFQLSMLSTIGLIYFTPWLAKRLRFIPEHFSLRETVSATIAATVSTLPIIILQFKQVALLSLVANLLILPLLPYTMFFGAVALLAGTLWVGLATILSAPGWLLLSAILWIIRFLSELSWVYVF